MITLLSRLLIPDHEKTDLPEVRRLYGVLSGTVGIFLNLILFAGKLAAGILAHSISIMADAFNNLSDAASSVITLIGFQLSGRRADRDHPFGHGRIEYISGLFVSILILMVGFELGKSSLLRILHPQEILFSASVDAAARVSGEPRTMFSRPVSSGVRSAVQAVISSRMGSRSLFISLLVWREGYSAG